MIANAGVLVVPGRASHGSSLGQTVSERMRGAAEIVGEIKDLETAVGLLTFIEFLANTAAKLDFVLKAYRGLNEVVARDPSRYKRDEVTGLQAYIQSLENLLDGIRRFTVEPLRFDRTTVFETIVTAGLAVKIVTTDIRFMRTELLRQIPERLRTRIVVERWTGPAKDQTSEQRYEAVEFPVPAGVIEAGVRIVSEGARTSLLEDGRAIESLSKATEEALKSIGLGAAAAVAAVPWIIRIIGTLFGRTAMTAAQRYGVLFFLRGLSPFTFAGASRLIGLGTLFLFGREIFFGDLGKKAVEFTEKTILKLLEAANNAATAVAKGTETIVIIGGIAIGVLLVGGAIAYVVSK